MKQKHVQKRAQADADSERYGSALEEGGLPGREQVNTCRSWKAQVLLSGGQQTLALAHGTFTQQERNSSKVRNQTQSLDRQPPR